MKIQSTVYKFLAVCSLLTLFAHLNPVAGQEQVALQKADSLFKEQRYTQAYRIYDEILESGKASAGMLLRMSYIQESLGNISRALYLLNVYYQQTNDEEVLQKIEKLAEQEKLQGFEYSDRDYFLGLFRQYRLYMIMSLMGLCGILFLWVVYSRLRQNQKPVWQGAILLFLLAGLYGLIRIPTNGHKAIIAKDYVYLMSGPSAGSSVVDVLRKGHRLKVLGREDVWYKVEWKNEVLYVKETGVKQV